MVSSAHFVHAMVNSAHIMVNSAHFTQTIVCFFKNVQIVRLSHVFAH